MTITDTRDDVVSLLASKRLVSARRRAGRHVVPLRVGERGRAERSHSQQLQVAGNRGSNRVLAWTLDTRSATDLILMRFTDVTELAAETGAEQGSVLLRTGVALVESAQLIVRTCSTSSRTDRLSIDGHYLRSGDDLAAKARMAHTRPGSYILPILMPLAPPQVNADRLELEDPHESDERRMTRTMAQTFAAISARLDRGTRPCAGCVCRWATCCSPAPRVSQCWPSNVFSLLRQSTASGATFVWASGHRALSHVPATTSIPSDRGAPAGRSCVSNALHATGSRRAVHGPNREDE